MRDAWKRAAPDGKVIVNFPEALVATALAKDAAPYLHPRLAVEKHQVLGPDGQPIIPITNNNVLIYLPDNGRDPDIVTVVEGVAPPQPPPLEDLILRPDPAHGRELREAEVPAESEDGGEC
jgi:hypothetical protein